MKNTEGSPQNWRAQIITRQTKLPKISKKIAELEGRVGGDNKYPETKGTKNYAQNKTSKNLQKIAKLEGRVGGGNKYPIGGHK
jgi:hypothetical protein